MIKKPKNLNKNRIFKKYYVSADNCLNISNFVPRKNIANICEEDIIVNYPHSNYSSTHPICVYAKETSSNKAKRFMFLLKDSISLENCDALCFGYNSRSSSNFLAVTMISDTGETFAEVTSVGSERWTNIIINIKSANFCGKLKELAFSLYGTSKAREQAIYEFSDFKIGKILDLDFSYGEPHKLFIANTVLNLNDGLEFDCKSGTKISSPQLVNPRYTELNVVLSLQDTVVIALENLGSEGELIFTLYSDKSESCYAIQFAASSGFKVYKLDLSSFSFGSDERLLSFSLVAVNASGRLKVKGIKFTCRNSYPSLEAAEFLQKDYVQEKSPYCHDASDASCKEVSVRSFGATGDGFTDDTIAIQRAIDCSIGKPIVLSGGEFVVTSLKLYSNTKLVINPDSVLVQNTNLQQYSYSAMYEHDNIDKECNWAHNFLVNNMPLIYAADCNNIIITGGGTVRMADEGAEQRKVGFPYWPTHCAGIIHVLPMGFDNCENIEVSNITIIRASSYHCFFNSCQNVFLQRLLCYEVRCLSADGIGLCNTKNVLINNCLIETNDDGITLFSSYKDARCGLWWRANEGYCVENIEVKNSYIDSSYGGGGKAIAFIPWGTNAPDISMRQIKSIYIHDNVLNGGHSIGAWADNPYNGSQPFDNCETDDYSPVFNIIIVDNQYRAKCSLECIKASFVTSDCSLEPHTDIVNGDFKQGLSYFNVSGTATANDLGVLLSKGSYISQQIILTGSGRVNIVNTGVLSVRLELLGSRQQLSCVNQNTFDLPHRQSVTIIIEALSTANIQSINIVRASVGKMHIANELWRN